MNASQSLCVYVCMIDTYRRSFLGALAPFESVRVDDENTPHCIFRS